MKHTVTQSKHTNHGCLHASKSDHLVFRSPCIKDSFLTMSNALFIMSLTFTRGRCKIFMGRNIFVLMYSKLYSF